MPVRFPFAVASTLLCACAALVLVFQTRDVEADASDSDTVRDYARKVA